MNDNYKKTMKGDQQKIRYQNGGVKRDTLKKQVKQKIKMKRNRKKVKTDREQKDK